MLARQQENAVVGLEKHIRETLQLSERKEERKKESDSVIKILPEFC